MLDAAGAKGCYDDLVPADVTEWRAEAPLALIFSNAALQWLPGHTALENVELGMLFGPGPGRAFAEHLLERLGLADRMRYRPPQLSLGQQQRVALARALANRPQLVLADEPTGSLDVHHAGEALALTRELCSEQGAALLLVSHDAAVLGAFETRLDLAQLNRAAAEVRA